ncbi:MAG: ABC transporter substrate-binding protein [Candidatus Binataceae bacterium]
MVILRTFWHLRHRRQNSAPGGRFLFVVLALSVVSLAPGVLVSANASATDAMAEAKATVDQVLQILKNPEYKSAPAQLRQKLRSVIGGHFDFTDMSRSALGIHWESLSEQQRNEFVPIFTSLLESAYMSRIENYSGQQIQFVREISDGPGYAEVYTNIVQNGAQPIGVNYRLKQSDGGWKVYDVLVDGISLVQNYRAQFNRVINSSGYDSLVELIKMKVNQADSAAGGSS